MSVPPSMGLPRCARLASYDVAGGPLAALVAEPRGTAAATAVLVPGFTGSKEDFLPLLEPLADAGVRVVAIDQRGQCDSPGSADASAYSAAGFADDLARVTGAAAGAEPLHLLGHSFGGIVTREMILRGEPSDRPLSTVTLLDSGPAAVEGPSRARLELFLQASETLTLGQIHELEPVNLHEEPEVSAFLLRRWLANSPGSLRAAARWLLTEPDRTEQLRAELEHRELPCLVCTGEDEDVWSAPLLEQTAKRLGARFAAIPGAGHSPNTQQPAALAEILLDFWLG